jgi:hypothetical protein
LIGGAAAHHDGLDDAALADRIGQLDKLRVGEQLARIARIGADEFNRHLALAARTALDGVRFDTDIAHQ